MKTFIEFTEELDESIDDKFARDSYSTTRGKVVKTKIGTFVATDKSGSTKSFDSKKDAEDHAMKEEYDIELAEGILGNLFKSGDNQHHQKFSNPAAVEKLRKKLKAHEKKVSDMGEWDDEPKFARDSYSTTRGKVVKTKSGLFLATNKSGSTKSFTSEKAANNHALNKSPWDSEE